MGLLFEWDSQKAERNIRTHGVSFDEASTSFRDPLSRTIGDPLHSEDEERYVLIGQSIGGRLLVVVHTFQELDEQNAAVRIISARLATKHE